MDPTTLVTFLYRAPPEARTVELLGSWDNFQLPYRMHHDRLRGNQFYSGCFKFESIIYDGHDFQSTKPRSGGLKQGGSYWYYYRLNYDFDAYDERQPYTTNCPLLPGQKVNALEVPLEVVEPPVRCHSALETYSDDIIGSLIRLADQKTLDPAHKYEALEPPPVSKVHTRCHSDDALDGRLEGRPPPIIEVDVSSISASSSRRARSPRAVSPHSEISGRIDSPAGSCSDSSEYLRFSARSHAPSRLSAISEMSLPVPLESTASGDLEYRVQSAPCYSNGASSTAATEPHSRHVEVALQVPMTPTVDETFYHLRASQHSAGPLSVQDVQFYGSPSSNILYEGIRSQPRIFSVRNTRISSSESLLDPSTRDGPELSPCSYQDLNETPIAEEQDGCFDMVSPTFSLSTVSSTSHNTPFRLSQDLYNEHLREVVPAAGVESETRRSSEPSSASSTSSGRPSLFERSLAKLRPQFTLNNYSLPTIASESNHSLAKSSSHYSARVPSRQQEPALPPMPSIFTQEEGSMADAIFSELGFLNSSINVN